MASLPRISAALNLDHLWRNIDADVLHCTVGLPPSSMSLLVAVRTRPSMALSFRRPRPDVDADTPRRTGMVSAFGLSLSQRRGALWA